ncbi:MBL fold metallo-hydrolase [Paenibacillus gorillae]|uniref:MBL fold metallo-hydrolase n=1 Tax=Paenibacillus gorillae TaxID=1243662 RepID=UPI0004AEDE4A|nr:MBL fold metallo-hydrolase [Paenibacillus gorillae]
MIVLICLLVFVLMAAVLVIFLYPPLGKRPSALLRSHYQSYPNYDGSKFHNQIPTSKSMKPSEMAKVMADMAKGDPLRKPSSPLETVPFRPEKTGEARAVWLGHSAVWVELAGKTLLLDPMFGRSPSPFPIFGNGRYSRKLPFDISQLGVIDAVILSHDHYDHLDYGTIRKLKNRVRRFIVPAGVSIHLEAWGVRKEAIEEYGWGETAEFEGLKLVCAPARHFSGRNVVGENSSLWCSWIIEGGGDKLFFSGDSGYGPHFREIGEKYGPFDLTLIECGQYDDRWRDIHMLPEQSVQAHLDVRGKRMVPIHWGAFTLAVHDWHDPINRVVQAAKQQGVELATPRIGEPVAFRSARFPASVWWQ